LEISLTFGRATNTLALKKPPRPNTIKFLYKKQNNHVSRCYRCGGDFEEGEIITRTQTRTYKYRHEECYTDAHGRKL
jgi:hypothetical protein